jgi:GAF domain-containing protein/PilZ domain-containing protein
MIPSHRRSVRLPVRTLVCNLDHWNEATVLNVSEGGLALQAIAPVNMNRPVRVVLDWAEVSGSIEAGGVVAWNERGRTGLRFTSLGDSSRARLVEWLFQEIAARFVRRQPAMADRGPHGLTLPVPDARRPAEAPARAAKAPISPAPQESSILHLTALLTSEPQIGAGELELPALLDLMAKRAHCITHASGAAIALGTRHLAVCMARSGASAPDLGVTISAGRGLAGECLGSGAIVRSDDVEQDGRAGPESSRPADIRSTLLLPLFNHQTTVMGLLGVFSERPSAFDDYDQATLQRMTDVITSLVQPMPVAAPAF